MKTVHLFLPLLLAALLLSLAAPGETRPNIVFIFSDDHSKNAIRDERHKVWVSDEKKIIRLHDIKWDPREKTNLLNSDIVEHKEALQKFQVVGDSLPDKDAH